MMNNSTIYLVDDDEEIIKSLTWLLQSVNYQVESYASAKEFLKNYQLSGVACLVLDIRMQGMTGLELQDELNKRSIDIPIIFMTAHGDIPMSVRAMKHGAIDFLTKPVNSQQLLEAVNRAIQQQTNQEQQQQQRGNMLELVQQLTPREQQVMNLMVAGKQTKVIADQLGISTNTAEVHRAKVIKKMQVRSLAELIHAVVKYDLLKQLSI